MKAKFTGLVLLAASVAVLSLGSTSDSEAGLFSRLFGGRAYNGCGGGGGGLQYAGVYSGCGGGGGGGLQYYYGAYNGCGGAGGGGLQMYSGYSSCGDVGGGGGLQFAPTYYAPSYTPASNCPGGVCTPSSGGLTYSAPVYRTTSYAYSTPIQTSPVALNPGEQYVAGSLRAVPYRRGESKAVTRLAYASVATSTAKESSTASKASTESVDRTAEYKLVQFSQDECVNCIADQKLFETVGVEVEVVKAADNPLRLLNYLAVLNLKFEGYPYYVLLKNGEPYKSRNNAFGSKTEIENMASVYFPKPEPKTYVAQSEADKSTNELLLEMIRQQQKTTEALIETNKSLQSIVKVSQR